MVYSFLYWAIGVIFADKIDSSFLSSAFKNANEMRLGERLVKAPRRSRINDYEPIQNIIKFKFMVLNFF